MPSAERDPTEPGVRSRRSTRGRPLPIKTRALPIETPRRAHDRPFNPRRAFAEKKDALDAAIRGRRFARRRRCRLLPPVPAILLDAIAPPPPRGSHAVGGRGRLAMSIATWSTPRVRPAAVVARARGSAIPGSPRPSVSASSRIGLGRGDALASPSPRRDRGGLGLAARGRWGASRVPAPTPSAAPRRGTRAVRLVVRAHDACCGASSPPRPPPRRRLIPRGPERAPNLAPRRAWGLRARSRRFRRRPLARADPDPESRRRLRPDRLPARTPPSSRAPRAPRTAPATPPLPDPSPDPSAPPPLPRDRSTRRKRDTLTRANIFSQVPERPLLAPAVAPVSPTTPRPFRTPRDPRTRTRTRTRTGRTTDATLRALCPSTARSTRRLFSPTRDWAAARSVPSPGTRRAARRSRRRAVLRRRTRVTWSNEL